MKGNLSMDGLEKTCQFLKEAGVYYLATSERGQPHLRPFGTAMIIDSRLCIQTGKKKNVYKELRMNPKAAICAFKENTWIRIEGELIEDPRIEAQEKMLDEYPSLKDRYRAGDGNTVVFYFKEATVRFCTFDGEPEVYKI
jgi:uncharacterized pyridoxamine 5'-phosphate oxidase family protein